MKKITLPAVTDFDRKMYPYHTELSIQGILLIESLPESRVLKAMRGQTNVHFRAIQEALGGKANPNWIIAQCAERAVAECWIDERECDRITE